MKRVLLALGAVAALTLAACTTGPDSDRRGAEIGSPAPSRAQAVRPNSIER